MSDLLLHLELVDPITSILYRCDDTPARAGEWLARMLMRFPNPQIQIHATLWRLEGGSSS